MRFSQLFTKTEKEQPQDEVSVNAQLLERAGFIYKNNAGIYSYLPLGWRVLNKINQIIREEMAVLGAQEIFLPALVNKRYWEAADRWGVEVMYKIEETGQDFGLSWTHEEVVTEIAKRYLHSYRDLPFSVFQIQTKFRREPRAKSGLLRGREFLMKDLYSFHRDAEDLDVFYQRVKEVYLRIFSRSGFPEVLVVEASGGAFTKEYTHEFQVPVSAGEDTVLFCSQCRYGQNKEITQLTKGEKCPRCLAGVIDSAKAIEVGNIFKLGTRFSKVFNLNFVDEKGNSSLAEMGSYGLGPSRMMGALAEVGHDRAGLIWSVATAPFQIYLLALDNKQKEAEKIYQKLTEQGWEILYDDRLDKTAGEKFADADLIGLPWRIIVSAKTLKEKSAEIKRRTKGAPELVKIRDLTKFQF